MNFIFLILMLLLGGTGEAYVRFTHPAYTETQLFLAFWPLHALFLIILILGWFFFSENWPWEKEEPLEDSVGELSRRQNEQDRLIRKAAVGIPLIMASAGLIMLLLQA